MTGITGFIYPCVVHWVWDSAGFLSAFNSDADKRLLTGCVDFAGSGVVHMTGGWAAMVGAKILGPRIDRWERPHLFEGHSTPLQVIGTFLLWFGWYGFNPGSTLAIHSEGGDYARDAARAAVTTTLAGATAGVTGLFLKCHLPASLGGSGVYDIGHTCNSLLGGLVGITAGCSVISPGFSVLVGFVAAFVYHLASCAMRKFKIDDPLDAFAVHGACGFWAVVAVGLFGVKEYLQTGFAVDDAGVFMAGTKGELFGAQIITLLIEVPWVVVTSFILFSALKACGILRVPADQEVAGLDVSKHGGSAYAGEDGKSASSACPLTRRSRASTSPSTAAPPTPARTASRRPPRAVAPCHWRARAPRRIARALCTAAHGRTTSSGVIGKGERKPLGRTDGCRCG